MKKLLHTIILSITLAVSTTVWSTDKIAVTNMSKIFEKIPQRILIAKKLENEFLTRSNAIETQEYSLRTKIQKLQRDGSTMKKSERTKMENDIISQRNELSKKILQFDKDKHKRQIQEQRKLLDSIKTAVKKVADKEGYNIVIDTNAIAYISNIKDITAEVLKQVK